MAAAETPPPGADAKAKLDEKYALYASFWWLTDVPTFIDTRAVARLHDAIVQPEFVLLQQQDTAEKTAGHKAGVETEATGGFEFPAFLKFGLSAKVTGESSNEAKRGAQVTKQFVYSAETQLQDVVSLYYDAYPERVFFQSTSKDGPSFASLNGPSDWKSADAMLDKPGPRPLVFLDLQPDTKLYPTAAEIVGGSVVELFGKMTARWDTTKETLPVYPREGDPAAVEAARRAYWSKLFGAFNPRDALEIVETCAADGKRIDWIDFRMPLQGDEGNPIHLHLSPAGQYPTGVFGYYFVRRAQRAGVRLVGLLKGGGDINVLAFYER